MTDEERERQLRELMDAAGLDAAGFSIRGPSGKECPACKGKGRVAGLNCVMCGGKGRLPAKRGDED